MPTLLTHAAVPLAAGVGLGRRLPRRLLWAGVALALLPDLDVVGFRLGIAYGAEAGHRGFSHSLSVAALAALAAAWAVRGTGVAYRVRAAFLFLCMASHGLLDCLTTGGKGIALLWPFTATRYFAPVQVIRVSPFSPAALLSQRGAAVLLSEFLWVWLPCMALALGWRAWRNRT